MVATQSILAIVAVCLIGLLSTCDASVTLKGKCPKVSVVQNFNVTGYMGLWFESARYPTFFESGGRCVTATYKLGANGTVDVSNTQYNNLLHRNITINGNAVVVDNAKLLVNFPIVPSPAKTGSNYWVLDTDYVNFSVVFSCSPKSRKSHTESLWILTRSRTPSVQTILNAVKVMNKFKLSIDHLKVTNQEDCKHM